MIQYTIQNTECVDEYIPLDLLDDERQKDLDAPARKKRWWCCWRKNYRGLIPHVTSNGLVGSPNIQEFSRPTTRS